MQHGMSRTFAIGAALLLAAVQPAHAQLAGGGTISVTVPVHIINGTGGEVFWTVYDSQSSAQGNAFGMGQFAQSQASAQAVINIPNSSNGGDVTGHRVHFTANVNGCGISSGGDGIARNGELFTTLTIDRSGCNNAGPGGGLGGPAGSPGGNSGGQQGGGTTGGSGGRAVDMNITIQLNNSGDVPQAGRQLYGAVELYTQNGDVLLNGSCSSGVYYPASTMNCVIYAAPSGAALILKGAVVTLGSGVKTKEMGVQNITVAPRVVLNQMSPWQNQ